MEDRGLLLGQYVQVNCNDKQERGIFYRFDPATGDIVVLQEIDSKDQVRLTICFGHVINTVELVGDPVPSSLANLLSTSPNEPLPHELVTPPTDYSGQIKFCWEMGQRVCSLLMVTTTTF